MRLNYYFKENLGADATAQNIKAITDQVTATWFYNFLKIDPNEYVKKVKIPVLALNGENDLQVIAKENLMGIKTTLTKSGNKNVTVKEFPKLNHLFQESKTGAVDEYGKIEQTISPLVLTEILTWLKKQAD